MGWRLVAVPFLVLLTVMVVVQAAGSTSGTATDTSGQPPTAPEPTGAAAGSVAAAISSAALPAGPDYVAAGAGTWHTVPGGAPVGGTAGPAYTYTVEAEDGVQSADADRAFAAAVDATLADPRSWIGGGPVTLAWVESGDPSFRISLTSQMTIRSPGLCGWDVPLEASCFNDQARPSVDQ